VPQYKLQINVWCWYQHIIARNWSPAVLSCTGNNEWTW